MSDTARPTPALRLATILSLLAPEPLELADADLFDERHHTAASMAEWLLVYQEFDEPEISYVLM